MAVSAILTVAVALSVPIWLVVEELLHRSESPRRAEHPALRRQQEPAKLTQPAHAR
jgi:hypothetical protein